MRRKLQNNFRFMKNNKQRWMIFFFLNPGIIDKARPIS